MGDEKSIKKWFQKSLQSCDSVAKTTVKVNFYERDSSVPENTFLLNFNNKVNDQSFDLNDVLMNFLEIVAYDSKEKEQQAFINLCKQHKVELVIRQD